MKTNNPFNHSSNVVLNGIFDEHSYHLSIRFVAHNNPFEIKRMQEAEKLARQAGKDFVWHKIYAPLYKRIVGAFQAQQWEIYMDLMRTSRYMLRMLKSGRTVSIA